MSHTLDRHGGRRQGTTAAPQTNSNHDPTITCRQPTSIRWRNGCATKGRNTAVSASTSPTSLASTPPPSGNTRLAGTPPIAHIQNILGPAPEDVIEWVHDRALHPDTNQRRSCDIDRTPFEKWIYDNCQKLGLNLEKFAARHGVHSTTLGDYEVGKANISDVKLMELVRMYSVPEAYEEWRKLRHLSGQDPRSHSGDLNDGLCRFGILLRTLRKELGVSQRELCRALGKDSKYICNLEYGYTRVTPEIILRIADYLNVPERIPDCFAAVDEDDN